MSHAMFCNPSRNDVLWNLHRLCVLCTPSNTIYMNAISYNRITTLIMSGLYCLQKHTAQPLLVLVLRWQSLLHLIHRVSDDLHQAHPDDDRLVLPGDAQLHAQETVELGGERLVNVKGR